MSNPLRLLNFSAMRRLPMIRQVEAAECGLACIAMICSWHGRKTDLNALRLQHAIALKGASLRDLVATAARLGLHARPLRVELASLCRLQGPCILHWDLKHFVVLKSVTKRAVVIHDPARGIRKLGLQQVSAHFTGVALELLPGTTFTQGNERVCLRLSQVVGGTTGLSKVLLQLAGLSLVLQLFVLVSPLYMQLVVDDVLTARDTDLLLVLAAGFCLLVFFNAAATALRSTIILHASNQLGFQLVANLFSHLVRLPLAWFEKRHVGDILSRFASTAPVRRVLSEGLVAAAIDGLMATGTLALMFVYNGRLAAIVTGTALLYVGLRLAFYKSLRERNERQIVAGAREQSTFIETVRAIQSLKIYAREAQRQSVWQNRYADVVNGAVSVGRVRIGFHAANVLLFGMENTLVVYVGAMMIVENSLTIGMLFAFMAYKQNFVEKISLLVEQGTEFRLLKLHLERLADIGLASTERESPGTHAESGGSRLATAGIELDRVAFAYDGGETLLLKHVSLRVAPGEMVAIVGRSGCGKTTLLKLMLGLLEPLSGDIRCNGRSLRKYGRAAVAPQSGAVMQGDVLLAGSVGENIAFFDDQPDVARIRRCARAAEIHDDIQQMPMAYNSLVGDLGDALSAGQRQRILLARALYRDPQILVLDEGTANLDGAAELRLVNRIRRMRMTRICVAHRAPLILAADRVLLLEDGALIETSKERLGLPGATNASCRQARATDATRSA